jgi:hypothetical protein
MKDGRDEREGEIEAKPRPASRGKRKEGRGDNNLVVGRGNNNPSS